MLFPPGRPWSEATDIVRDDALAACWIVSKPTSAERAAMRRWLAAARLSADEGGRRHPDLPSVLAELEASAVEAFRRVYVEGGTLISDSGREAIAEFVSTSRSETLVVRLLPPAAPQSCPRQQSSRRLSRGVETAPTNAAWLSCLIAADPTEAVELTKRLHTASNT